MSIIEQIQKLWEEYNEQWLKLEIIIANENRTI